jgi:antitoxin HicB
MKYHFKVYKEKKGYWAECIELKGCLSQGDSKAELQKNLKEALELYLSEPESSGIVFPEPLKNKKAKNIIQIKVDPVVAFAVQLRQIRLKRKLTQKAMMEILKIKHLSNYQRLENPSKANPELKTLAALQSYLPELSVAEIFG